MFYCTKCGKGIPAKTEKILQCCLCDNVLCTRCAKLDSASNIFCEKCFGKNAICRIAIKTPSIRARYAVEISVFSA